MPGARGYFAPLPVEDFAAHASSILYRFARNS